MDGLCHVAGVVIAHGEDAKTKGIAARWVPTVLLGERPGDDATYSVLEGPFFGVGERIIIFLGLPLNL